MEGDDLVALSAVLGPGPEPLPAPGPIIREHWGDPRKENLIFSLDAICRTV